MLTYPHHLTTDLPELPVPSLQDSMERFRIASAAVYGAAEEADVNQALADFVVGPAPALQQTLEEYATVMADSGSNWVAEHQLEQALANRDPLQLSTNTTYQLDLPTSGAGTDRVVELLQRIGAVHIKQAKRDTEEEYDDGGRRLSMDPWAAINGGIRTPALDQDVWVRAGTGATFRTVGLLYFGRMWEVPLTGSTGKLLEADQLRASVEYVLSQTQPPEQNFVSLSALGSGVLATERPWDQPDNREPYTRLTSMLFTLTLDQHVDDPDEAFQRWTFLPGYAWVYKPISYIMGLNSDLLAAHVEHSVLHFGTLATAVARMQQVDLAKLETLRDPQLGRAHELVWQNATYDLSGAIARAIDKRTQRVVVRRDEHVPFDISADVRAQLVLMIAQHLTYGRIRAHGQTFDMRHYRAGRTEMLRPVTLDAVNFVQHLVQDQATESQFMAAIQAHQDCVEVVEAGQGFDSHLDMLQQIGQELGGANAELFTAHNAARENFLTTFSTDDTPALGRAIVPQASGDGFGVSYSTVPDGTEFVVTWQHETPQAEEFVDNLEQASQLLYEFIGRLAPII